VGTFAPIPRVTRSVSSLLGLWIVVAVILAACDITGGGWMASASAQGGKATFGFGLTCNGNGHLTGGWVYHDKAMGVDVGGTLTDSSGAPDGGPVACTAGSAPGSGLWTLRYTAQHCRSNCVGVAVIGAEDTGLTGPSKGDGLSIELSGGRYDGYSNARRLGGGNLTVTN